MIPPLHIVTDDEILRRQDFLLRAVQLLEVGGRDVVFHLRGPRTGGKVLFSLAQALAGPAESCGGTLLANDRIDLALVLDLPGAHLGQRSLPPEAARAILGPDRLLGLSVHGVDEVSQGLEGDVDFLMVGTIFRSASHPEGVPGGLARIREIKDNTHLPLVAIGGMEPGTVRAVLASGARGVAVRGGIWNSEDPSAATLGYLKELKKE